MEEDWNRLGSAVAAARRAAGYAKTKDWVAAAKKSDRQLLGLERGEPKGRETLEAVEDALGWERGTTYRILNGEPSAAGDTRPGRTLSVVPTIVEGVLVAEDDDNEVLAAIRRDPDLDEPSRMHFLNQYELLRELSLRKKAAVESGHPELLPYVAHGKRTEPVDPEEERRIEEMAREAARNNPHSPYRDK